MREYQQEESQGKKQLQISFGGGGFLVVYYFGVVKCMMERAPNFLERISTYYGTSAGAFASTFAACGQDVIIPHLNLKQLYKESKEYWFGLYNPFFDFYGMLTNFLHDFLPENAHMMCRDVVKIGLSVIQSNGRLKNWVVTDFRTKTELINVRELAS